MVVEVEIDKEKNKIKKKRRGICGLKVILKGLLCDDFVFFPLQKYSYNLKIFFKIFGNLFGGGRPRFEKKFFISGG